MVVAHNDDGLVVLADIGSSELSDGGGEGVDYALGLTAATCERGIHAFFTKHLES